METGAHVNRMGGYAVEIYEIWAHRYRVSSIEIDKNRDVLRMAAMKFRFSVVSLPLPMSTTPYPVSGYRRNHGMNLRC